ncbi:MAG: hypothetical protein R3E01_12325 [Pirellulaceae bacterium]
MIDICDNGYDGARGGGYDDRGSDGGYDRGDSRNQNRWQRLQY